MQTSGPIRYRELKEGGYQLLEDWRVLTSIVNAAARVEGYVELAMDGWLTLRKGYRWDGASGPAIDRPTNMRASLAHDGLYQLMRASKLPQSFRGVADELYRALYVIDGGFAVLGWLAWAGLRLGAGHAAEVQPDEERVVLTAP